jgi:cystathionine beta-lyase/cystathionine gamma-synthase
LEEVKRFLSAIRVFTLAVSLGGIENLAVLPVPALMIDCNIPPAERAVPVLGMSDDLIRLSWR